MEDRGGWNLPEVFAASCYREISRDGAIRGVLFPGEPYRGRPTEVFAYIGVPETTRPVPGMVCLHGGGGRAYKEWVALWLARGYAAISMDFGGCGPSGKPLPNGGPPQSHEGKFPVDAPWEELWTYHAISACLRAHSILRTEPGVDADRIGATGISWGGYLTCIMAGVDPRLAFAAPVYGCGFLRDNSAVDWMKIFAAWSAEQTERWHRLCDPSIYLGKARMPLLFVSGTNDFAYPLDSLQKSYRLPAGPVQLCIRHEMPHGHMEGWAPEEIAWGADQHLRGATPLPEVGPMRTSGRQLEARIVRGKVSRGWLLHTADTGRWQDRKWQQSPARLEGKRVVAELPEAATVFYLAIEDERGAWINTPHACADR